jgi:hypothetical protein
VCAPFGESGGHIGRWLDDAAFLAFDEAVEGVGEEDVVGGDFIAEVDGKVEVLGLAGVAETAHGFVGEDLRLGSLVI